MRAAEIITRLGRPPAGPQTSFSQVHVVRALLLIASSPGIGRKRLAEALGLGEGAARTLLSRLKEEGLIRSDRTGCYLTQKAQPIYEDLSANMTQPKPIDVSSTWPYLSNVAIIVRSAADRVGRGIEQRDSAIRAGARGAMTLVYKGGRLLMPGISDVSTEYPDFAERVLEQLHPNDYDVIIIVGADNRLEAENGAIAAALVTLGLKDI